MISRDSFDISAKSVKFLTHSKETEKDEQYIIEESGSIQLFGFKSHQALLPKQYIFSKTSHNFFIQYKLCKILVLPSLLLQACYCLDYTAELQLYKILCHR